MCIWIGLGWQFVMDVCAPFVMQKVAPQLLQDADVDVRADPALETSVQQDVQPSLPRRKSRRTLSQHTVVIGIVFVLAAIQIGTWYGLVDQSDNWVTEEFCKGILEPLPDHAIAILKSDHIEFPVRYLQVHRFTCRHISSLARL